ncbi:ubiquinol-cytochrome c reductase iron-sulfur subunit [Euzebya tangerina]|uniref:QcrA and Rieske domain-containing protein n=1 Tax=Euzebya tangerina TaxID=591198 RepID=UPI000E318418|nr:ubiquinol-cytochrome c reductase iron-sulfur subunit [Euzebya tangerina]
MADPASPDPSPPNQQATPAAPVVDLEPEHELIVLARTTPEASSANDTLVIGTAIGAAVFGIAFAVSLVIGLPIGWYGMFLALAFFSLGLSIRRYFFDRFPEIEAAELREVPDDQPERPVSNVPALARRPLLTRVLLGSAGVFGASLLALVPSLGPRVGEQLRSTPWASGVRLKTTEGEDIRAEDLAIGTVVTAWPADNIGFERAAVLVMRLSDEPAEPTNMEWVIENSLVAYSKICTHAGCPVALFRERENSLFCPCHQSTFDVRRACQPTFGPATRPLPQLPLGTDDAGFLIALGDFVEPPGPSTG